MLTFSIEIPNIDRLIASFEEAPLETTKAIQTALRASAIATQGIARAEAPVRTGLLRNSIGFKVEGLKAIISPTVKYALYVHEGTGIYNKDTNDYIKPSNGKRVFATKKNPGFGDANAAGYYIIGTKIKGQKPNPFMKRTVVRAEPIVRTTFRDAMTVMTKGLQV